MEDKREPELVEEPESPIILAITVFLPNGEIRTHQVDLEEIIEDDDDSGVEINAISFVDLTGRPFIYCGIPFMVEGPKLK